MRKHSFGVTAMLARFPKPQSAALLPVALMLLTSLLVSQQVEATFDRYAGMYKPVTKITDEAALDLDQLIINEQLYNGNNNNAMHVYREGGHSGSFAVLRLINLTGEGQSYPKGTIVIGKTNSGDVVEGYLQSDYSWDASTTEFTVTVTYKVEDSQANYMGCQVGGLHEIGEANRTGCFTDADNSTVTFVNTSGDNDRVYNYVYNQHEDNMNSRTLQGLSLTAKDRFMVGGNYFDEFEQFVNYYGEYDYADRWILAADEKRSTGFKTGLGDIDFSIMTYRPGRGEAMKKGDAYLIFWMEVAHELAEAVHQCKDHKAVAVHHVDLAVAYYAGSLSTQPETEQGILLNALAEVRSHQSKTAGQSGNLDTGEAYVNIKVFHYLNEMKNQLIAETPDCDEVLLAKEEILNLMKIPLVQGVIRYGHIRQYDYPETLNDQERTRAEGATFAATVLPFVHKCDTQAANTVWEYMRVESNNNNFSFAAVRNALESTYACMGFSCEQVGGVWGGDSWKPDGQPCGGASGASGALTLWMQHSALRGFTAEVMLCLCLNSFLL